MEKIEVINLIEEAFQKERLLVERIIDTGLDLIQYNAEGEITLYPGASLTVTPVYEIDVGFNVTEEQTITTTVA